MAEVAESARDTRIKSILRPKAILLPLLFLVSGTVSGGLFFIGADFLNEMNADPFIPGILFIISTLISFAAIKLPLRIRNWIFYTVTMYLTYLAVFWLTIWSVEIASATGIVLCGLGAVITFKLTSVFIRKIKFKYFLVFILGGVSYIAGLLASSFFPEPNHNRILFDLPDSFFFLFFVAFLLWQVSIGTTLSLTLMKSSLKLDGEGRLND